MTGAGRAISVLVGVPLTIIFLIFVVLFLRPMVRYQEDLSSHRIMSDAYRKFYREQGRAADSLREIVESGYLPRVSYIYSSPNLFVSREYVSFECSVYGVVPADDYECKVQRFCIRRIHGKQEGFPEVYSQVKMDDLYPARKSSR